MLLSKYSPVGLLQILPAQTTNIELNMPIRKKAFSVVIPEIVSSACTVGIN